MSASKSEDTWPRIFKLKNVPNALQLTKILIVMPISNVEVERVFSRFSKMLSKDRLRLDGSTQEAILRVKDDFSFSNERYVRAIELFLTTYPTGEIRSSKRRLACYKKKEKKKKKSRLEESAVIDFSSDEDVEICYHPMYKIYLIYHPTNGRLLSSGDDNE